MLFNWDDLLESLDDRSVVPVIGQELLEVQVDGGTLPLYRYLGRRLADELGLENFEPDANLSEAAMRYLQAGGDRTRIYSKVRKVLRDPPQVPESLRRLAKITNFDLFISTTPDSLLIRALDEERFGGRKQTTRLDFSTKPPSDDVPMGFDRSGATVFSLFGRAKTTLPDYAVTAEDHLEFLTVLQDKERQPKNLFSILHDNNLLFLGCSLPEWLVRFFFRTVKNERLAESEHWKFVADERVERDNRLVVFLELYRTQVFQGDGKSDRHLAQEFVAELFDRWAERPPSGDGPAPPPRREAPIFLSYSRDDREQVRALKESLDAVGLAAWMDEDDIPPGADWDDRIRRTISRCQIFVPCLSSNTEADLDSYFRREWKAAVERREDFFGTDRHFLWPVVLDDLAANAINVPDAFRASNWTWLGDPEARSKLLSELTREVQFVRGGTRPEPG